MNIAGEDIAFILRVTQVDKGSLFLFRRFIIAAVLVLVLILVIIMFIIIIVIVIVIVIVIRVVVWSLFGWWVGGIIGGIFVIIMNDVVLLLENTLVAFQIKDFAKTGVKINNVRYGIRG